MAGQASPRPAGPIVLLGAGGLLGRHLAAALESGSAWPRGTDATARPPDRRSETTASGAAVRALPRQACDITDADAVARACEGAGAVIQCAAFTNVDGAEAAPAQAHRVNVTGSEIVARAARAAGARLIHVSTDFVFDGAAAAPYEADAPPRPLSVYGRTKAEGEARARAIGGDLRVVRVQALYGRGGTGFSSRLPSLVRAGAPLRLDGERRVQPTPAGLAARLVAALLDAAPGTYHVSAAGETTWAGFARALAAAYRVPFAGAVLSTDELRAPAERPRYCLFGHASLAAAGLAPPPAWQEALAAALPELD